MSKTIELYTAITKGIQSQGFTVVATAEKITAKIPGTETIVFEGDIEAAQDWLLTRDFNQDARDDCPSSFDPDEWADSFRPKNKPQLPPGAVMLPNGQPFIEKPLFHTSDRHCEVVPVERPLFLHKAFIYCVLSTLIFSCAIRFDHNPGTFLLGLPGVWLFVLAISNVVEHLQWVRKNSEVSR